MLNALLYVGNHEHEQILNYWKTKMSDNLQWQEAEKLAEQGGYAELKLWIQNWAHLSF